MKICYDTLENMVFTKNGTLRRGNDTFYIKICTYCGEECLARKNSTFCDHSCANKEENHPFWKGGISSKDRYAYTRKWKKENRDKCNASLRKWKRDNPDKWNSFVAERRATKLNQTPKNANKQVIRWYYTMAMQMSKRIGIAKFYHVDHIIPLAKGGLHHEDNLQILTATQNLKKNDRVELW